MMSAYSDITPSVERVGVSDGPVGEHPHADSRFLNDVLNSSYVAGLSDPNCELEIPNLGVLIVAAHAGPAPATVTAVDWSDAPPDIIESAANSILDEARDNDVTTTLARLDALPVSSQGAWDDVMGRADPISVPRSYEETELEILKIGVMNPGLYDNLRQIFVEHKYPDKMDAVGRQLREFFLNQRR